MDFLSQKRVVGCRSETPIREPAWCYRCFSMFYLYNGTCLEIPANCKAWRPSTGVCLECFRGERMVRGKCVPNLVACLVVNSAQQCERCEAGYERVSGGCAQILSRWCLREDRAAPQLRRCLACKPGYKLANGTCYIQDNSKTCSMKINDFCIQCKSLVLYNIENGKCVVSGNR